MNIVEFFEVIFVLFWFGVFFVFVLFFYRSSEIIYFCEFVEVKVYIIFDMYLGFDYREFVR